jgi:hypothetical protein
MEQLDAMKGMQLAIKKVDLDEDNQGMREMCRDAVKRTIRDANDFGDFHDIAEFMGTLESIADPPVKSEVKDAMELGQSFEYFTNLK